MRVLLVKETFFHSSLVLVVIISYIFLFNAAMTVQPPNYQTNLSKIYTKLALPNRCSSSPVTGYLAQEEWNGYCQLNIQKFTLLCEVLGVGFGNSEAITLFKTLDISGNGYLSWGELSLDYFGVGKSAMEYYLERWRHYKSHDFLRGLKRIDQFDYSIYKF